MTTISNTDITMKKANALSDICTAIFTGFRLPGKCLEYSSYVITKAQSAASVEKTAARTRYNRDI
jgi:hypothetical protein